MDSIEQVEAACTPSAAHSLGPFRAIGILVANLATQVAAVFVVMLAAAIWVIVTQGNPGSEILSQVERVALMPAAVISITAGGFTTLILTWVCLRGPQGGGLRVIGWNQASVKAVLIAAAGGLLLGVVYIYGVYPYFPPDPTRDWGPMIKQVSEGGWPLHLWAAIAVCLAPPTEELLFRGVLLAGFTRKWPLLWSGAAITLLFVAGHLLQVWGYIPGIACIFGLGVATLLARIYTKSLAPPIALHAAYNLVIVLSAYGAL